jgi:hypothetical protein
MSNNEVNQILSILNITPYDLRLALNTTQAGSAILSVGLFISWIKSRHPGVLLSCVLFGLGAYYSYFSMSDNDWWPLLVAFTISWLLKSVGYQMGYH